MDIANNAGWGDIILEKDNLKIFLKQKANNLLSDAIIDFDDEYGFLVA